MLTWTDRVRNLTTALGRKPTFAELMEVATIHILTPEEIEAQRRSWARGMSARCEHGVVDFEQCPDCRRNI